MKQTSKKTSAENKNGKQQQGNKTNGNEQHQESLLEKFFIDQLRDIYYAEQQLIKAIPEMQRACTTEELEDAFGDHLKQTERHVKRLERVFQTIGRKAEGEKCEAIEGIIREVKKIISETKEGTMTRDAALIIAAQKVEHYEIATYGGLVQLAITMNLHRAAEVLDKTLMEEEATDRLLTDIAEMHINIEADYENYSWNQQEESHVGEYMGTSNSF